MSAPQPVLFFGNDWAAENRTSSHHIARCLARHTRVVYVESPGLRAPQGTTRDLRKIVRKVLAALRRPRAAAANLQVVTLLQLPFHGSRLVRWINEQLVVLSLLWIERRCRIERPILWFMLPHLPYLVGRLGEAHSVYYCIDHYAAMPGVNSAAIERMDEELTRKAGSVFVASETLEGAKRRLNGRVMVSAHGVDVAHFGRAQLADQAVATELAGIAGPVVGFFGLIEGWIDLELIEYLARSRPGWTFVLIGRVAVPRHELPDLPNVRVLGSRPYESLPAFGKRFDAAIIPYRLVDQVRHANPLKLREYLAMGKPIVGVRTPEIERFADVLAIADSPAEFLQHLDRVIATPPSRCEVERRVGRVRESSWERRVDDAWRLVTAHAEQSAAHAGA